jgi:hypothetical protein
VNRLRRAWRRYQIRDEINMTEQLLGLAYAHDDEEAVEFFRSRLQGLQDRHDRLGGKS